MASAVALLLLLAGNLSRRRHLCARRAAQPRPRLFRTAGPTDYMEMVEKSVECNKAELLQLNRTQFPSLGFFISEKVGDRKN